MCVSPVYCQRVNQAEDEVFCSALTWPRICVREYTAPRALLQGRRQTVKIAVRTRGHSPRWLNKKHFRLCFFLSVVKSSGAPAWLGLMCNF